MAPDKSARNRKLKDSPSYAKSELVRGKSDEEILSSLAAQDLTLDSAEEILAEAKEDLKNPEIMKLAEDYVANIDFIKGLEHYYLTLLGDSEENTNEYQPSSSSDSPAERMDDERVLQFYSSIIKVNALMGWSKMQSVEVLSAYGLPKEDAQRLIDIVYEERAKMSEGAMRFEGTTFDFTRKVIEQDLRGGLSRERIIHKVQRAGWPKGVASYIVGAAKLEADRGELHRQATEAATTRVQQTMYFDYPIILPPNPLWEELPAAERRQMKGLERELQAWRNRGVALGVVSFGVLATYYPWLQAVLFSLSITLFTTSAFTVWHSKSVDQVLSRIIPILVIASVIFAAIQVLAIGLALLPFMLGFFVVYVAGLFLVTIVRMAIWKLRS